MVERRTNGNTTRQCARFGCNAPASATFTFDSPSRTVWLDTPLDGNARAGELCARHATSLSPPRGWILEDRRATPAPSPSTVPDGPRPPDPAGSRQLAAGPACHELEEELRGLLDADSPLLARAFRSSGTV
jgi:uncharacterized protein DUF3499